MAYPAPEFVVSPEHLGIDPNQPSISRPRISNGRMCGSLTRDPVRVGRRATTGRLPNRPRDDGNRSYAVLGTMRMVVSSGPRDVWRVAIVGWSGPQGRSGRPCNSSTVASRRRPK